MAVAPCNMVELADISEECDFTFSQPSVRRWLCSGLQRRLDWCEFTNVSKVCTASITRAMIISEVLTASIIRAEYQTTQRSNPEEVFYMNPIF
jgi:hypothetical protein